MAIRTHCHNRKLQNYKRKGILYCHTCHMHYDYSGVPIGIHGIPGILTQDQVRAYYADQAKHLGPMSYTVS